MNQPVRFLLIFLLLAAIGGGLWMISQNMESRMEATSRATPEASRNPLLAARLFLQSKGIKTRSLDELSQTATLLPEAKVLLMTHRPQHLDDKELKTIQQWVEKGGILITSPADEEDEEEDTLLAPLKIREKESAGENKKTTHVQPPGSAYPLLMDTAYESRLEQAKDAPQALWQDQDGDYLRAFAMGNGQIVVMTNSYAFTNEPLRRLDHAELLWHLVQLNGKPAEVILVSRFNSPKWYWLFWQKAPLGWSVLPILLILMLWRAVRRFGPILPAQEISRRALLEHIDACGRWLWQEDGGAQRLLQANRKALRDRMAARMPEWVRLPQQELSQRLARRFKLSIEDVENALNRPVSKNLTDFTTRIRILQFLRKKL